MTSFLSGLFSHGTPKTNNPLVDTVLSTMLPQLEAQVMAYVEPALQTAQQELLDKLAGEVPATFPVHLQSVFSGLSQAQVEALWQAAILTAADVATGHK